ncbi:MAG: VOC family protein [Bdellovibrionales bacterium]|nr:VOC family protein [Bdellovibrionales bacterium]
MFKRKCHEYTVYESPHHIGLTVSNLEESAKFLRPYLAGRKFEGGRLSGHFVSDGQIMLTLWATKEEPVGEFNKNKNVGLHHIAFSIADEESLNRLYVRLKESGVKIEFSPELLGPGPAKHMMCYEPSGIRVEFTWPGN